MTDTPTAPKLHRPTYWTWLAPEGADPDGPEDQLTATLVVVNAGDQLRAELEGKKHGLAAQETPMHLSALWIWAAMVRTGHTTDKWPTFKARLVAYTPPEDQDDPKGDEVVPTGASTS